MRTQARCSEMHHNLPSSRTSRSASPSSGRRPARSARTPRARPRCTPLKQAAPAVGPPRACARGAAPAAGREPRRGFLLHQNTNSAIYEGQDMARRPHAENFLVNPHDDQAGMSPMSCFDMISPNEAGMSPMSCFDMISPNENQITPVDTLRIKEELNICMDIINSAPELTNRLFKIQNLLKNAISLTQKLETKIIYCKSSEATCLRARARGR
jgi:hypothetical protein